MSRIGKQPIPVPSGVEVKIDGSTVTVKGPKGELSQTFSELMSISLEDGNLLVGRPDDSRQAKSLHGLTRTLLSIPGSKPSPRRPAQSRMALPSQSRDSLVSICVLRLLKRASSKS